MHMFMVDWMMPFSYLLTYSDRGDSGNIMKITRKDVSSRAIYCHHRKPSIQRIVLERTRRKAAPLATSVYLLLMSLSLLLVSCSFQNHIAGRPVRPQYFEDVSDYDKPKVFKDLEDEYENATA